jgi:hypothetical protein
MAEIDEFDTLTGDPLPKTNKAVISANSQSPAPDNSAPPLSGVDKELIELCLDMPRNELKGLLQRVARAGWGYGKLTGKELLDEACKTKDEAYEALKLAALTLAVNASDWREFNALATFWAEREKGKPKQSIEATVTVGVVEIVEEIARRRKNAIIDVTPG